MCQDCRSKIFSDFQELSIYDRWIDIGKDFYQRWILWELNAIKESFLLAYEGLLNLALSSDGLIYALYTVQLIRDK